MTRKAQRPRDSRAPYDAATETHSEQSIQARLEEDCLNDGCAAYLKRIKLPVDRDDEAVSHVGTRKHKLVLSRGAMQHDGTGGLHDGTGGLHDGTNGSTDVYEGHRKRNQKMVE